MRFVLNYALLEAVCVGGLFLAAAGAPPAEAGGRVLGPMDTISIRIVNELDLDATTRVEPDGTINFPYVGRIKAAGLTEDQLARVIDRRSASGLRKEAARGNLAIERMAGKDFVTLAAIEEMRERCRTPTDDWLLFDCVSPSGALGRGLSIGRIYDPAGGLVASAAQECLLAPVVPSERGT